MRRLQIICKTSEFVYDGVQQYAQVVDGYPQRVQRINVTSGAVIAETSCATSLAGCAIEEISISASGTWLVTRRNSGQGESGYDIFSVNGLERCGGIAEEYGYIIEIPRFSQDETVAVTGIGLSWLGGWWSHRDDDIDVPSRGGVMSIGTLLVHDLIDHRTVRHDLDMDIPKGWLPNDSEQDIWSCVRDIQAEPDGIRMTLPGGTRIAVKLYLRNHRGPILLPTPAATGIGFCTSLPHNVVAIPRR
jgi:hypothetical protein